MGSGEYCYPLTVTDSFSRYLLCCEGLSSTKGVGARESFERVFEEHGLPGAIRTDNGAPFASHGTGGLSRLSVWWLKLGIRHERIEPGHPEQNGRHERMHLTLKNETTRPAAQTMEGQQTRFDEFCTEFNHIRPHEALGQVSPGTKYVPSDRPFHRDTPEPHYPEHDDVRTVRAAGQITFAGLDVQIGKALSGETVGLRELEDDCWLVSFVGRDLGFFKNPKNGERRARLEAIESPGQHWRCTRF